MVTTKSGSPVAAYPVGFTSASSLLLEIDTLEIRHLYGGVIKKKTDIKGKRTGLRVEMDIKGVKDLISIENKCRDTALR